MSNTNSSSSSVGFTSLLLLTFIILKLCKVINWSWVWVLSPLWITASIAILCLIIYVVYQLVKKDAPPPPTRKSKLQERMEEMVKAQNERGNRINNL